MRSLALLVLTIAVLTSLSGCVWRGRDPFFNILTMPAEFMTGGLAVWNLQNPESSNSQSLPPDVDSAMSLTTTAFGVWVPFLVHYYHDAGPHRVRLRFNDPDRKYSRIEIREMVIETPSGECARKTVNWSSPLNLDNTCEKGCETTNSLWQVDCELPTQLSEVNTTIRLIGRLTDCEGQSIPFESQSSFRTDRKRGVMLFWYYAAYLE